LKEWIANNLEAQPNPLFDVFSLHLYGLFGEVKEMGCKNRMQLFEKLIKACLTVIYRLYIAPVMIERSLLDLCPEGEDGSVLTINEICARFARLANRGKTICFGYWMLKNNGALVVSQKEKLLNLNTNYLDHRT